MRNRSRFRFVWLFVSIAGVGFMLTGFLTTLAASHASVRIANHAGILKASGPDFVPSAEQHRQLSEDASGLSRLFGNCVLTQMVFVFPVTILAFATFVVQSMKPRDKQAAQPATPGYRR